MGYRGNTRKLRFWFTGGFLLLFGIPACGTLVDAASETPSTSTLSSTLDNPTGEKLSPSGNVTAASSAAPTIPTASTTPARAYPSSPEGVADTVPPVPPPAPEPTPVKPVETPALPAVESPTGTTVQVLSVVDGDTIKTVAGKIRLIGIDTPERGECNYQEATNELAGVLAAHGNQVVLAAGAHDDTDNYGRLLRYVNTADDNTDINLHMVQTGYAIARYDSRDGYGAHPRETVYIAADIAAPAPACPGTAAGADPKFTSCTQAKKNGYGPYTSGQPEYSWYKDADSDGVVCE